MAPFPTFPCSQPRPAWLCPTIPVLTISLAGLIDGTELRAMKIETMGTHRQRELKRTALLDAQALAVQSGHMLPAGYAPARHTATTTILG